MTTQKYFITGKKPETNSTWFYLSTGKNEDLAFYREVEAWLDAHSYLGGCVYKKSEHSFYMPGVREWVINDFDKQWSMTVTYEVKALVPNDDATAFEEKFAYKEQASGEKQ
jgi:hypothetical protein